MIHTNQAFAETVERTVASIETRTDAEIVVVAAERSGHYRDIRERAATAMALLVLSVILWIPHPIAEPWVLLDLTLVWLFVRWQVNRHAILRALTREERRRAQVLDAAERSFHAEAVHGTPGRIGVLVYVSALEGHVEVLPDLGVEGAVPRGELAQAMTAFAHNDLEHFVEGLEALGDVLAKHLPHHEGSDDVNLPNAPRILT